MQSQIRIFQESKNNKNVLHYNYNTSFSHKFLMFIIPMIFGIPFLLFAIFITAILDSHFWWIINGQTLIFVPLSFLLSYFGLTTLTYVNRTKVKVDPTLLPVFKSHLINTLISIIIFISYILLIVVNWIPNLPDSQKDNIQFIAIQHALLFLSMMIFTLILGFSLALVNAVTKGVINVEEGYFFLSGKTLLRKKFNEIFHFNQPIKIIIQPFIYINPVTMKSQPRNSNILGIFLEYNNKIYKIFDHSKDKAYSYAKQLSMYSNWQLIEKQEIFSFVSDDLALSIAR